MSDHDFEAALDTDADAPVTHVPTHSQDGRKLLISFRMVVLKIFCLLVSLTRRFINALDLFRTSILFSKLKKKVRKALELKISQLKIIIGYLDEDYAETKAALYPLLEQGNITFELLWALYRPGTVVYTPTYSYENEPRAFSVRYSEKHTTLSQPEYYKVVGKHFDFDGKEFRLSSISDSVETFRGDRKTSALDVYPIKYYPDHEQLNTDLINRGKKFVLLAGMHYKALEDVAFMKSQGRIIKFNVNGRVMCDLKTFRRVNPNYPISNRQRKDPSLFNCDPTSDSEYEGGDLCDCTQCLAGDPKGFALKKSIHDGPRMCWKIIHDPNKSAVYYVRVAVDANGNEVHDPTNPTSIGHELEPLTSAKEAQNDDGVPGGQEYFSDEEFLIASPVIVGFSFSEKMWVEMSVSGIGDVKWNQHAFESLVLPAVQKDIVKALVTSHSSETKADARAKSRPGAKASRRNIDDIISGKGKGLVSVLHGNPGTGKTLTAEGIAEHLKCPLYCVSAGGLGTSAHTLEAELTKILDVAHAWGAVLLLDEADVFLEARGIHDIHRNALVSTFLRLLEYFQGILFLTSNRVQSFDEAFQSRIHIALRYQELDRKARRKVWVMFLDKVRATRGSKMDDFSKENLDALARKILNGRQIKNAVRSATALALYEEVGLSMQHLEKVLNVADSFEKDLKGGS